MTRAGTKQAILARHVANDLLLSPSLPVVPRHAMDLSADQPVAQPDPAIVEYVTEALRAGQTHYADVPGMPLLREALAAYLRGEGYSSVAPANILVTAGMQETRFLALQNLGRLLGPVAIPDVVHPGVRKALGVRPLSTLPALPTARAEGYLATLEGVRAALEGGAKVLFLESPVRLSGAVYHRPTLSRIAELVEKHEAVVLWDQGLAPWVADYASIWNEPGMERRAVLLGEAFPGVGLESWYIGYIVTGTEWWEKLRRDKQAISICTSTPDQLAAIKAAELYPALHPSQLQELAGLRSAMMARLNGRALPGETSSLIAVELADFYAAATLRKRGFEFADGADFGARGVIRLAVTAGEATRAAIALLV